MKNSYKKISAIVLAGVVVMGASLSSASAASFKGYAEAANMIQFGKRDGFDVLEMEQSEEGINKAIGKRFKGKKVPGNIRQRLKDNSEPVNNMGDYEKLLKSGMRLHKIKVGDWYYLIRFDNVSIYGASRKPQHRFYSRENQRSYDAVEYYSREQGYEIVLVKDSSSYGEMVEMSAKIRGWFRNDSGLMKKLLKGPSIIFGNVDSFISKVKSGDKIFEKPGHYRVKVGDLEYLIRKR